VEITVRGGKDHGNVRQINGKWFIRTDSFYMNGAEMEDAYDANVESGWYSNLRLAETPEDLAIVEQWKQDQEQKAQARVDKMYEQQNTACFVPYMGQRVTYRYSVKSGTISKVTAGTHKVCKQINGRNEQVEQSYWTVEITEDGKKTSSPIAPYYLKPETRAKTLAPLLT